MIYVCVILYMAGSTLFLISVCVCVSVCLREAGQECEKIIL